MWKKRLLLKQNERKYAQNFKYKENSVTHPRKSKKKEELSIRGVMNVGQYARVELFFYGHSF